MALFPNIPFLDDKDRDIQELIAKRHQEWIQYNQTQWHEASLDTRAEAGDQGAFRDMFGSNIRSNRMFSFNRMRRVANMITGHQRRNRRSTVIVPIENGDQKTADQFTKILKWNDAQAGVDHIISDAFHRGSVITGMNLLGVDLDYTRDPISGDMKVTQYDYNDFIIDPFFRNLDLSDCQGIFFRTFVTKNRAKGLAPDHADMIDELQPRGIRDYSFMHLPESMALNAAGRITYDQFWYPAERKRKLLVDTITGSNMEWIGDQEELDIFKEAYPEVQIIDQTIPTINLAVLIEGKVIYNKRNPLNIDVYPFVPVVGYFNPQMSNYSLRIQGVMRGLRDAQFLYNRRKIIELDILESQVNSGWKYKVNALVDPTDIFLSGQGKGIGLKSTADMQDVQKIEPAQVPPSMLEISRIMGQEISEISGVSEELLGAASDDQAGILSMLRQSAGLTTLQLLFDNLDRAQKLLGSVRIQIIQANWTPGKVQRILNEEPTDEFYTKNFGKYDSAVEEGFNTTTQKQLQFAQLLQLRNIGINIPARSLVNAATVQGKDELVQAIEQQEQQAIQIQQQQIQAQLEQLRAQAQLAEARAIADRGLGIERLSRVDENRALAIERVAQSQENRANARRDNDQALLNFIKALQEIESVDLENIEKLIRLSREVERPELQAGIEPEQVIPQDQDPQALLQQLQQERSDQEQITLERPLQRTNFNQLFS